MIDARLSFKQADSINFSVRPGEICVLTGSNKEVLEREHFIRVLKKERPLEHGEVHLNGKNMKSMKWVA